MALFLAAFALLQTPVDLTREVRQDLMKEVVAHLSAMPNRNTSNPTLTEAAEYVAQQYRKIPGLQVEIMHYTAPRSSRVPVEKEVDEVLATLPGETDRRVIVGGHLDSINMRERSIDSIAPGANDDLSGMSQAMEVARVMAGHKWKNTMVFVAFSGEEQGLFGSRAIARRAKAEGWKIDAVLSSDIVGNSVSLNGQSDKHHVRVFSEDNVSFNNRGEQNPVTNSRELARFIEWNARGKIHGFEPKLIFRLDRYQRGGDHSSFNQEGYSAVRFTEAFEEFTRQHSPDDLMKFVDFSYVANVARLNLLTAATLANADPAPTAVRLDPKQAHDTIVRWKPAIGRYVVYWRETTSPVWQGSQTVDASKGETTIVKVNKDDYEFAVGAEGGVPVAAS